MKKIFVLMAVLAQLTSVASAGYYGAGGKWIEGNPPVVNCASERSNFQPEGVYVDGRGQIAEFARIAPPHPENIPKQPRATRTVEPYDSYYHYQILGNRRPPYAEPMIPGYNMHYSTRIARPYTRKEFMDVWCASGVKNYKDGSCTTDQYVIYFVHARNWAARMVSLPFKALQNRGKKMAVFLCVSELGRDSSYVTEAKRFSTLYGVKMYAGTIDSYLPLDWFME